MLAVLHVLAHCKLIMEIWQIGRVVLRALKAFDRGKDLQANHACLV